MSLQVKLISAMIKKDEDAFSKNDPYVIFRLGNEEQRSKVKEEGGNKVEFNETFTFKSQDDHLKVIVMDDDFLADDKLGEGQIQVGQYRNQPYPQDVQVIASCDGKPTCKIYLKIMGGQGGQFGGQQNNQWGGQQNQFGGGGMQGNTGNQATFFGAAQQLGQQGQQGGQGQWGGNQQGGQGQWGGQGGQGQWGGQQGGQGQWGGNQQGGW